MNSILARWHTLAAEEAVGEVLSCCGSAAWARKLTAMRPFANEQKLFAAADECWQRLPPSDWLEAFRSHPRIGEQIYGLVLSSPVYPHWYSFVWQFRCN